jgi:pSer/pThr/pTyr-binding forkhead associated (FHA) protein
VLGRSRSCDVTLGHDTVSRRHAELTMDGDRWTILDLGSTNGTWLGSARVHRAYVQSGTVVGLGALPVQLY